MLDFTIIINRLKEVLKIKSDKEMYEKMGTNQGKYSMWKQRNKIPYEEITTLCCNENLNINYILFGTKQQNFVNYREENHKMIDELEEKQQEKTYHFLKMEILNK